MNWVFSSTLASPGHKKSSVQAMAILQACTFCPLCMEQDLQDWEEWGAWCQQLPWFTFKLHKPVAT